MSLKLDLGCGYKKREGFTRMDRDSLVHPDVLHDLCVTPWPLEADCAELVLMNHVLEHLCPLPDDYKRFWQEVYRVCTPEAAVEIFVPHWTHETFIHDPTHVRPITAVGLAMMDKERNRNDIAHGGSETTLGLQWNVDFVLRVAEYRNDPSTGFPMECHYILSARKEKPNG